MDSTLTSKLRDLDKYVQQMKKLQKYSYGEIKDDQVKIWAIERGLQLCIQSVIDIGNRILSSIEQNQIKDYTDILDRLGQNNILPSQFAEEIRGMAGFRNILVHQYAEVDLKQVHDMLQNRLGDFEKYIGYIQSYLRGKQSG